MANVTILSHPLIKHKLSIIRDKSTSTKQFKECLDEIAGLMAYEISRDLETKEVEIETPISLDQSLWKVSGHWDHYKNNL